MWSDIWRPFYLVLQGRWRLYAVNKKTTPYPQPADPSKAAIES